MRLTAAPLLAATLFLAIAGPVFAQPGPDGYDFVTVGAPGNRAYDGQDPFDLVAGRGAVPYEFRIGRTEVTTSQWMDLFNAMLARPDPLPLQNGLTFVPIIWGATVDPAYTGPGTRYKLRTDIPNAGQLPVGGVSWRQCAVLCNWLSNNKSTAPSAFMNGAYDVSTFTGNFPVFGDQPAHNPGAPYWIPTLDEWMKAVHYDPNGNGGQGRWWEQPNGTDTPLIYGPPPSFGGDGMGQANSGFTLPGLGHYHIPVGSYQTAQSPWGLLDAAGGPKEWFESIRVVDGEMGRGIDGSYWGGESSGADLVYSWGQESPATRAPITGFRIASAIPTPSSVIPFVALGGVFSRRRRRTHAIANTPVCTDMPANSL